MYDTGHVVLPSIDDNDSTSYYYNSSETGSTSSKNHLPSSLSEQLYFGKRLTSSSAAAASSSTFSLPSSTSSSMLSKQWMNWHNSGDDASQNYDNASTMAVIIRARNCHVSGGIATLLKQSRVVAPKNSKKSENDASTSNENTGESDGTKSRKLTPPRSLSLFIGGGEKGKSGSGNTSNGNGLAFCGSVNDIALTPTHKKKQSNEENDSNGQASNNNKNASSSNSFHLLQDGKQQEDSATNPLSSKIPSNSTNLLSMTAKFGYFKSHAKKLSNQFSEAANLAAKDSKGKMERFGNQLHSAAKDSSDRLERNITNIALKTAAMEQHGRKPGTFHPDIVQAVMTLSSGKNGSTVVEEYTENVPLLEENWDDTVWSIPLRLPQQLKRNQPSERNCHESSSDESDNIEITIRIQMKSGVSSKTITGAALANKYYTIGHATFKMPFASTVIPNALANESSLPPSITMLTSMLQSNVFQNSNHSDTHPPVIDLYVLPYEQYKLTSVGDKGWSLTDATHFQPFECAHMPPLHQLYAYSSPFHKQISSSSYRNKKDSYNVSTGDNDKIIKTEKQKQHPSIYLATERTNESTVVLPIATAMLELISTASVNSASHARSVNQCVKLQSLRVNSPLELVDVDTYHRNNITAVAVSRPVMADIKLGLCHFHTSIAAIATQYGSGLATTPVAKVRVLLQSTSCSFEQEVILRPNKHNDSTNSNDGINLLPNSNNAQGNSNGGSGNKVNVPIFMSSQAPTSNVPCSLIVPFYPPIAPADDSSSSSSSHHFHHHQYSTSSVGTLRFETVFNAVSVGTITTGIDLPGTTAITTANHRIVEGFVNLDPYMNRGDDVMVEIPMFDVVSHHEMGGDERDGEVSRTGIPLPVGILVVTINANIVIKQQQKVSMHNDRSRTGSTRNSKSGTSSTSSNSSNDPNLGLVHFMGLTSNHHPGTAIDNVLTNKLPNMGDVLPYNYLSAIYQRRNNEAEMLRERYAHYRDCCSSSFSPAKQNDETQKNSKAGEENEELLKMPFKRRIPNSFRPSTSKTHALLSSLPFNTHVQSIVLEKVTKKDDNDASNSGKSLESVSTSSSFSCVTCGASSDHAKKFNSNNKNSTSSSGAYNSGGLRRLLHKRSQLIQTSSKSFAHLLSTTSDLLATRQSNYVRHLNSHGGGGNGDHSILERNVHGLRVKCSELYQQLLNLTWELAVRRANCFSQALAIALTSYLSQISDKQKSQKFGKQWVKHGFLLTYEGMLSAAGKEMGMIEDASDSIDMLKGVKVKLVLAYDSSMDTADNGSGKDNSEKGNDVKMKDNYQLKSEKVPIPGNQSSPLKWVEIYWINTPPPTQGGVSASSASTGMPNILVCVGVEASFYNTNLPKELRSDAVVSFHPVLFQMGVDIRQWGANATASIAEKAMVTAATTVGGFRRMNSIGTSLSTSQVSSNAAATSASKNSAAAQQQKIQGSEAVATVAMDSDCETDDEDNNVVNIDQHNKSNDLLIALNSDAFREINTYAHAVIPIQQQLLPTKKQSLASSSGDNNNTIETGEVESSSSSVLTIAASSSSALHPVLSSLHNSIRESMKSKMEVAVLHEAANACTSLGGGSIVFCKSGKDRTAMQVTLKQMRFIREEQKNELRSEIIHECQNNGKVNNASNDNDDSSTSSDNGDRNDQHCSKDDDDDDDDALFRHATIMRSHGTRLALCEKNVGQPKYAFNSLQAKFMPDLLKPPLNVIAGFLKGGKAFTDGFIES